MIFFLFLLREILRYKIVNSQICQVFVIWLLLFLFSNQLDSCRCNTCSYFYCLQLVGTCLQAVAHKYAQTTEKQIIYLWKFVSTSLCTGPDLIWPQIYCSLLGYLRSVFLCVRIFHCFLWAFSLLTRPMFCCVNSIISRNKFTFFNLFHTRSHRVFQVDTLYKLQTIWTTVYICST